jgi:hypothetical protein
MSGILSEKQEKSKYFFRYERVKRGKVKVILFLPKKSF